MAIARALGSQAVFRIFQGDLAYAENNTVEALEIRQEIGDLAGVAMSKTSLGLITLFRGNFDGAKMLIYEARDIATSIHHANSRETAVSLLGWIASMQEDYETGWRLCQASWRNAPDPTVAVNSEMGLAFAACGRKDYQSARHHVRSSLAFLSAMAGYRAIPVCLPVMAAILADTEAKVRAVELLALAFSLNDEAGHWLEAWPLISRLRAELEVELGTDAYAAAWKGGLELSLEATMQTLLEI